MIETIDDWIDDERAVSPVIGVILMVAITVILAAVIGTFVLDLGQSAGQTAPQASLSVSVNTNTENVTVEHTGGDAIDASETRVIIENASGDSITFNPAPSSSTLSVGGSVSMNVTTGDINSPWNEMTNTTSSFNDIASGDQITITIIDTASQRQIFETTVTA